MQKLKRMVITGLLVIMVMGVVPVMASEEIDPPILPKRVVIQRNVLIDPPILP